MVARRALRHGGLGLANELSDGADSLLVPAFATAPAAGANAGAVFRVGTSLYYDNGTALVPLDKQGDWASRTVTNADATAVIDDNVVYLSSTDAHTFSIPASSTLAFPLNKLIEVVPVGTGLVKAVPAAGVSFAGPGVAADGTVTAVGQGKPLTLVQRAVDIWQVFGGFVAPSITCTLGAGDGVTVATLAQAGFRTVPLDTVAEYQGGFGPASLSSGLVAIPLGGKYSMVANVRLTDGSPVRSYGLGVNTSNVDSPAFWWDDSVANRYTARWAGQKRFAQGDQARLFQYSDGQDANITNAALSITWIAP